MAKKRKGFSDQITTGEGPEIKTGIGVKPYPEKKKLSGVKK